MQGFPVGSLQLEGLRCSRTRWLSKSHRYPMISVRVVANGTKIYKLNQYLTGEAFLDTSLSPPLKTALACESGGEQIVKKADSA